MLLSAWCLYGSPKCLLLTRRVSDIGYYVLMEQIPALPSDDTVAVFPTEAMYRVKYANIRLVPQSSALFSFLIV